MAPPLAARPSFVKDNFNPFLYIYLDTISYLQYYEGLRGIHAQSCLFS